MSPCARSRAAEDFAEGTREEFTSTTAGPGAAADENHTPGVKAQEEASEGASTCLCFIQRIPSRFLSDLTV